MCALSDNALVVPDSRELQSISVGMRENGLDANNLDFVSAHCVCVLLLCCGLSVGAALVRDTDELAETTKPDDRQDARNHQTPNNERVERVDDKRNAPVEPR